MEQRQKVDTRSKDDDNNEEIYKFPLSRKEVLGGCGVLLCFVVGLAGVYLTLPDSDYSFLKLPRTLQDLHVLRRSTS
ncbi:SNARE associated Golgi protein [Artemisia annua]|uniref:SNARE associated Golgi protein n=1 Tax=Artemisia annua TaxID=35608 RepID=A0A2U1MYK2_ARTAN|nr:SNARE associated Golgi protein [Artemisia annua]